jgi:DNA-nicking Smr family endonuclease
VPRPPPPDDHVPEARGAPATEELQPVLLPIDGLLDLHTFSPRDVKDLVPEWLRACQERGLREVRIVHGKGTGALRRTVESLLDRSPLVARHHPADEMDGGWGATLVTLHPVGAGDQR